MRACVCRWGDVSKRQQEINSQHQYNFFFNIIILFYYFLFTLASNFVRKVKSSIYKDSLTSIPKS